MTNLKIYCVSDKQIKKLEDLKLELVGVGNETFPENYIQCNNGINIQSKEKHYSELTFHYWLWKNELNNLSKDIWIGFCQKRRFWIKDPTTKMNNIKDLSDNLLRKIPEDFEEYDAFICEPISVSPAKKIKMLKKGWRNLIKDPSIFFSPKKQSVELQFDMFHGYGLLNKAIEILPESRKYKFKKFVTQSTIFNPHIMVISKRDILQKWFEDLFNWLFNCEKIFGFKNLKGYGKERIYAFLAERYLSFWFKEFYKTKELPWTFYDTLKN